ncbi:LacI family DNA-binding transcriptional regulator [Streptomyces sp. ODS28]|uniref:LacI family DNA-binding transcriptional regulator n=1 Tax=Streptomyces sp. ODS28 TaxID=3136688 RepID=UPI0031E5DC88
MTEVTLRDVAQVSGCSVSTVSRVLAGSRPVGEETARAVREAAERLGYRPNRVARALRSRATGTVGLVVPQITNPFFPFLMRAVERALHAEGRAVLLADCDEDTGVEASRLDALLERQVDGLVVIPVDEERSRAAVTEAADAVPLVLLDRGCGPGVADSVAVDNAAGMALVLEHLRRAGRSRVCFAGADSGSAAAERHAAYVAGAARLDPEGPGRTELGDFSVEWGRTAAERLWPRRPDAVVCANDLIAVGVVQRLRQLGVRVPEEVAVTGFDDVAVAGIVEPALTTVRQPVAELAAEAARLLARRPDTGEHGHTPQRTVRLAPRLIVRESSESGAVSSEGDAVRDARAGGVHGSPECAVADDGAASVPQQPHQPHPERLAEAEQ